MRRSRTWPGPALAGLLLMLLSGSAVVTLEPAPALAACSGTACMWPDTGGCAGGAVPLDTESAEWAQCRVPFAEFDGVAAQPQYFFPVFWSQPDAKPSARSVRISGWPATRATPHRAG
jgi:hypothetical protein